MPHTKYVNWHCLLFFLVVKTNVGYSVVLEFVIQHEDSSSITEALHILKQRWDAEGIKVGNFMIDCQQSEENAIWGVFPESCIYLCGFHRLQAWLRWLVNTKNGVSGHKDHLISLLCNIADATTEEKYTSTLLKLQKSHIWSKHVKLRNYYMQQWAPKKLVSNLVHGNMEMFNMLNRCYRCGYRLIALENNCTTTQIMVLRCRIKRLSTHS